MDTVPLFAAPTVLLAAGLRRIVPIRVGQPPGREREFGLAPSVLWVIRGGRWSCWWFIPDDPVSGVPRLCVFRRVVDPRVPGVAPSICRRVVCRKLGSIPASAGRVRSVGGWSLDLTGLIASRHRGGCLGVSVSAVRRAPAVAGASAAQVDVESLEVGAASPF